MNLNDGIVILIGGKWLQVINVENKRWNSDKNGRTPRKQQGKIEEHIQNYMKLVKKNCT